MLQTQDVLVLLVATASLLLSFNTTGSIFLKPSWSHTLEATAGVEPTADAPLPIPAPVVADVDDDGRPEVIVAGRDGRLLLLDLSPPARLPADRSGSKWRPLPTKAEASLRSHVGLATGRRPVALQAGALHTVHPPERRFMIIVALTEDWTVLAFDHTLQPLWEHSLGSGGAARPRVFVEAAVMIAAAPVYSGDDGVVVVAGRTRPAAPRRPAAQWTEDDDAADGPSPPREPGTAAGGGMGAASQHYDYYALDGRHGRPRWEHRARDFHAALHGSPRLAPQMDYKLDLQALGGAEGEAEGRHEGELSWHSFSESALALLPFTWRHPHDGGLSLSRFHRTRRASAKQRAAAATASEARTASGADALSLRSVLGAAPLAATGPAAAPTGGDAVGGAANAVVARRQNGLEVVHLYTGRPLCQLPLPEVHVGGGALQAHADVNGDARIDHVVAIGRGGAAPTAAPLGGDGAPPGHHASFGSGFGAASAGGCLGVASSGLPVRDVLWNASICKGESAARVRKQKEPRPAAAAAPLLLPAGGRRMQSIFFVSTGRVSAVAADGTNLWSVSTAASWQPHDNSGGVLPSLSAVAQGAGVEPLILAVGEKHAVLVSTRGRLLASTPLPSMPVAPPRIADFDLDGIDDVVIVARSGYFGLRTSLGTGSLALQLLFGFFCLAVLLTLVLRQQDLAPSLNEPPDEYPSKRR